MRLWRAVLGAALLGCGTAAATALPLGQGPRDTLVQGYDATKAVRLFGELMSPYCRGLTLAACPSEGAESLRTDIRERLARGETPREIRAAYVAAWGSGILGAPPLRSHPWLWLLPALALAAGALGLTLRLRWLARHRVETRPAAVELDERQREHLAQALKEFDERE